RDRAVGQGGWHEAPRGRGERTVVAELDLIRDRPAVAGDLYRRREGDRTHDQWRSHVVTSVAPRELPARIRAERRRGSRERNGEFLAAARLDGQRRGVDRDGVSRYRSDGRGVRLRV